LRRAYEDFAATRERARDFAAFVAAGGESLLAHARFEALDGRFRPQGITDWRQWPNGFSDASGQLARALDPRAPEVEFHLFLQWRAARDLETAQKRATAAGMAIGLIADIAVGMDRCGSHAWSHPSDVLSGISIGAPPDPLGPEGQDWGLTSFSPTGLVASGFEGFLATLRAGMAHAGGVRIDHAMGLQRLWVVPDGAAPEEGTYLTYPRDDLLRLLALESHRHRAIVVGEDLGTVPEDFRAVSTGIGMLGMRVLWFERTHWGDFRAPDTWERQALALSTTHDLPTIAGWWNGRDIDWRSTISGDPEPEGERHRRAADRTHLWRLLLCESLAHGDQPPDDQPQAVIDGALGLMGATPCELAIAQIEDALGTVEQPNLPGTIDEHPNWRRRLPPGDLSEHPEAQRRLAKMDKARRRR
jgi:4-alpha-glucanotransferase